MSTLIGEFHPLLEKGWRPVFAQERTLDRAMQHALVLPCVYGRRTISRAICALGREQEDWSAEYKLFSRSPWQSGSLFNPVIDDYVVRYPVGFIAAAFDDTKLAKTGKRIATAFWQRDPMSPPFHTNLVYGLRFLQASLLYPFYREGDFSARALPAMFQEVPVVKKPGKRASIEDRQAYRLACKQHNLSTQTLDAMRGLRQRLDQAGAQARSLLATMDGSFCNKTIFKAKLERIELLARCRKDARLCFPAPPGSRRRYAPQVFTPEQVRQNEEVPWHEASVYFGGTWRKLRHKEIGGMLWKRGAGTRPLRLIVLAPVPYRLSRRARLNYRDPAYLLTTDLATSVDLLLQSYLDRWQIEVNHRDEKDLLGVGQAQVRSPQSVSRQPAFVVACYSLLQIAALRAFGPGRTSDYPDRPKWRQDAAKRPSCLDILALLRKEYIETSGWLSPNRSVIQNLTLYANT